MRIGAQVGQAKAQMNNQRQQQNQKGKKSEWTTKY
jgi:hypothetical protein